MPPRPGGGEALGGGETDVGCSNTFNYRGVVLATCYCVVFGAFLGGYAHLVGLVAFVLDGAGCEPGVVAAQHLVAGAVVGGKLYEVDVLARELHLGGGQLWW